jgi:multiple sugar transport system substrate-binding protein
MYRKIAIISCTVGLSAALLTGCSGNKQNEGGKDAKEEAAANLPVTLKVAVPAYADDDYNDFFVKMVAKKFPNVTLQRYDVGGDYNYERDILAKGEKVDLILSAHNGLFPLKKTGLALDLDPYVKKYSMDLARFDDTMIDAARNIDGTPDLTAIPYMRDFSVLFYNKDIFDKFGVAYPKDGMKWTEVTELARKVTRNSDGIQYRGLEPDTIVRPASSLGIGAVDAKTNKASVNTDKWKSAFHTFKTIYDIQGNSAYSWNAKAWDVFTKDRNLAMLTALNLGTGGILAKTEGLNWDMVSYPTFEEAPGISMATGIRMLAVTSNSDNKDIAFKIVQAFTSDEVLADMAGAAKAPVVKSEAVKKAFGTKLDFLKGKNLPAIFKTTPAKALQSTEFDVAANGIVAQSFGEVVGGKKDVNTALREAEEKINQLTSQIK